MTADARDNGKPTCCGPGDISACQLETAEEQEKTDSKAKSPKNKAVTDETKKDQQA